MAARRLTGEGNLADEIVDVLFEGKKPDEMVKIAKSLLDNTLSHPSVFNYQRGQFVAAICWEQGLNPPDVVKRELI